MTTADGRKERILLVVTGCRGFLPRLQERGRDTSATSYREFTTL